MKSSRTGPGLTLGAAVLFGLSAPAAKLLAGTVDPWRLAGLLYLGSGVGSPPRVHDPDTSRDPKCTSCLECRD